MTEEKETVAETTEVPEISEPKKITPTEQAVDILDVDSESDGTYVIDLTEAYEPVDIADIPDVEEKTNSSVSHSRNGMTMVGVGKRGSGRKETVDANPISPRKGIFKAFPDRGCNTNLSDVTTQPTRKKQQR